jgi:hypothetical protein
MRGTWLIGAILVFGSAGVGVIIAAAGAISVLLLCLQGVM